jgi:hypothetical protein
LVDKEDPTVPTLRALLPPCIAELVLDYCCPCLESHDDPDHWTKCAKFCTLQPPNIPFEQFFVNELALKISIDTDVDDEVHFFLSPKQGQVLFEQESSNATVADWPGRKETIHCNDDQILMLCLLEQLFHDWPKEWSTRMSDSPFIFCSWSEFLAWANL